METALREGIDYARGYGGEAEVILPGLLATLATAVGVAFTL